MLSNLFIEEKTSFESFLSLLELIADNSIQSICFKVFIKKIKIVKGFSENQQFSLVENWL